MSNLLILLDEYIDRFQRIIDKMNSIMDSFPKINVPPLKGDQWGDEINKYWKSVEKELENENIS